MREKRGQVTIFIIIAILLVVFALLIYFFAPQLGIGSRFSADNPEAFLQSCVEDDLESMIETISLQGGSLEPSPSYTYMDHELQYLCYINENYEFCRVQVPFLRDHIEDQLDGEITNKVGECFNLLKENYERKGYSFNLERGDVRVELLPRDLLVNLAGYEITISKTDTKTFDSLKIFANTNIYELVAISSNIVEWESTVGDADTSIYMWVYPEELKIQKLKQSDDTKVYIIENKKTGEVFQFATRSLAFPAGY